MSRTHHRKHLSEGDRAKRGGVKRKDTKDIKTEKQKRPNQRAKLRKEYLP